MSLPAEGALAGRSPGGARRVAMLSVHTSPLHQPGTGDAGGMNVYVVELSKRLAALGTEVEIFTRATSSDLPPTVDLVPGVLVHHVVAGPYEGLSKEDLPSQLCAFSSELMRIEATREPGHYDLVHSHYWLSGQVGWMIAERWGVPLVHSMHTLAKVKNAALAGGDSPEPLARVLGEGQVVAAADRLVANTVEEARQLIDSYDADPERVVVANPGVDLDVFSPGDARAARGALGIPQDALVLLFVGRLQPLKAPDVLVRAAARMIEAAPELRSRLVVAVVGGPSGTGVAGPDDLRKLAEHLGIGDRVLLRDPVPQATLVDWFRAATVAVVPSYSESFGLVAVEAQACGTPVVAAAVGGLTTVVRDGVSGILVDGHDPDDYAAVLRRLIVNEPRRLRLARGAREHARGFAWPGTAAQVLGVYEDVLAAHAAQEQPVGELVV